MLYFKISSSSVVPLSPSPGPGSGPGPVPGSDPGPGACHRSEFMILLIFQLGAGLELTNLIMLT